jgi:tetratricopeptide (TPR) repeat protein
VAENTVQDADDDLDLKPARAGTLFRLEMFTTNFLLGYWKQLVAVVVVFLVMILAWGQYNDITRRNQRETAARIAERLGELSQPLPYVAEAIAKGEEVDTAKLEEVADGLIAIGNGASRAARVEAYLTAAELYRLADLPDKQRSALTQAVESGEGILGYSASAALANLELAEGDGDASVQRLRELVRSSEGYLAEQAQIDLALALEHLGRKDEAAQVYDEFLQQFPESPRRTVVEQRLGRVSTGSQG